MNNLEVIVIFVVDIVKLVEIVVRYMEISFNGVKGRSGFIKIEVLVV